MVATSRLQAFGPIVKGRDVIMRPRLTANAAWHLAARLVHRHATRGAETGSGKTLARACAQSPWKLVPS